MVGIPDPSPGERSMKRAVLTVVLGVVSFVWSTTLQAATITYAGPPNGSWNNLNNWTIGGSPAGREPSSDSSDEVKLGGSTVHVTAPSSLAKFGTGGGTVHIDNGGILVGTDSYVLRYVTIHVNSGGQFPINPGWTIRTDVNVNAGGTASGGAVIPQQEHKSVTVYGTWSPRGTAVASGTSFTVGNASYHGNVILKSTGTIILDVFGTTTNEYFRVNGMTSFSGLFLNTGSIQLRPQGGYVPKGGDTFTLWTLAAGSLATMNIGDGSNISIVGSDCTLDTSEWPTSGKVTVVATVYKGTVVILK